MSRIGARNAGPVVQEAPPFPLCRQTVEDLEAARWNLLAWEPLWLNGRSHLPVLAVSSVP